VLYDNRGFTRHITGIPSDESDACSPVYQHAENPLLQCRFRSTKNAIAFRGPPSTAMRGLLTAHPRRHVDNGE
jgi:hypothetical protein